MSVVDSLRRRAVPLLSVVQAAPLNCQGNVISGQDVPDLRCKDTDKKFFTVKEVRKILLTAVAVFPC